MMKERAMAGPAPGRPNEAGGEIKYWSKGVLRIDLTGSCCPAIAVPIMVKMPEPMTAPIPREVRLTQPRDFFNLVSAFSESESNWSMPLQRNRGDGTRT